MIQDFHAKVDTDSDHEDIQQKKKCFEYSVHKIERSIEEESKNITNEQNHTGQFKSETTNAKTKIENKNSVLKIENHTASGNINPLITETLSDSPKEKMQISKSGVPLEIFTNELPIKCLDFHQPEISNSLELNNGNNNGSYQHQDETISKLNEEMQRLLSTLGQLDNECASLKYQLGHSQSNEAKANLISNHYI